jgi:hypothetical protein
MKELRGIVGLAFIFILNFYLANIVLAQGRENSDLEELSIAKFNKGEYYAAIKGFEELFIRYPKENSYNYYLGRCYLHTNQLTGKSAELLKSAALCNFNNDVHYYLAWALYKLYDFDNAEIAIHNFTNLARKRQIKNLKPGNLKALITKAREETMKFPVIQVEKAEEISLPGIASNYKEIVKGEFLPTCNVFTTNVQTNQKYRGIVYVPSNSKADALLYYSWSSKKTASDIYCATKKTGHHNSYSSALKQVNSDYNEDYPYFDSQTNTLYFCSDRPGGLGGFDIYMSAYDTLNHTFEEPKRMGFPVNSFSDDFLYVIDSTGKSAAFISNRSNKQGEHTIYHLNISADFGYHLPKTKEEIKEFSTLPVTSIQIQPETNKEKKQTVLQAENREESDVRLQEALMYQLKCDSLQNIILVSKAELTKEKDKGKRKLLFSVIAKAKREIQIYQDKADVLFGESKTLKQIYQQNNNMVVQEKNEKFAIKDKSIQKEKEVEGITLYSHSSHKKINNKDKASDNHNFNEAGLQEVFSILSQSPYSEENPIPRDFQLPNGLIYRIQLGAFSQNLPFDAFGGLTPLMAEEINTKEVTKYYVGIFKSSREARKALEQVKSIGFPDAFIVPYIDRKKISIQAAREFEFGKKK